jgi:hypothetical protein
VIEHLWPDEISGFLIAAHRVLREGGHIALDSPNRRVTQAIEWLHPEHTVEFTVDEIVELLRLAGFDDVQVRGVLLAYDAGSHRYLTLSELAAKRGRRGRAVGATSRPEDAFVWWAEASRGKRKPNEEALRRRVRDLFSRFRGHRLNHSMSSLGEVEEIPHVGRVVHAPRGKSGLILFGPFIPVPAGEWEASFELAAVGASKHERDANVAVLEVTHGQPAVKHAALSVSIADVRANREWWRQTVQFTLAETTMGLEFRVASEGLVDVFARASIDLQPAEAPALAARTSSRGPAKRWLARVLER